MYRITLCLLAFFFTEVALGQNVLNGNFETWTSVSTPQLDSWQTTGNVSKTSDAFEGASAIRLDNVVSSGLYGFVATGPIIGNKLGAIPYDEQPLSFRFRAKYDLALGDKSQITVLFALKGNVIAHGTFYLEGNSADTFTYFSVPITWQVSTPPDSVGVIISSLDLEQKRMNGDGYVIIDDFHFASITTRNKEIANGNFNMWSEVGRQSLAGWFTTDDYIQELSGAPSDTPFVIKSKMGRAGSLGLELKSQMYGGNLVSGLAFTGSSLQEALTPSFKLNEKWKFFEGYYQYKPENGDTAFLNAYLFKSGIPIGTASVSLSDEKTSYTYFSMEITYAIDIVPDSATIYISNSNSNNPRGNETWLLVDDLKFSNQNLGIFDFDFNKITVFPNPFKDQVEIIGLDRIDHALYTVRNVHGQLIREGEIIRNTKIDMRDADAGMYFLTIEGKHINSNKILIKE
jgi:Secretion system C-terminal sorting domain